MKKSILIDMLEHAAKAQALTEYTAAFTESSHGKSQLHSARFHMDDILTLIKQELNK